MIFFSFISCFFSVEGKKREVKKRRRRRNFALLFFSWWLKYHQSNEHQLRMGYLRVIHLFFFFFSFCAVRFHFWFSFFASSAKHVASFFFKLLYTYSWRFFSSLLLSTTTTSSPLKMKQIESKENGWNKMLLFFIVFFCSFSRTKFPFL